MITLEKSEVWTCQSCGDYCCDAWGGAGGGTFTCDVCAFENYDSGRVSYLESSPCSLDCVNRQATA